MPAFVALLAACATFSLALPALDALTRAAAALGLPAWRIVQEGSVLQVGAALALAVLAYRRAVRPRGRRRGDAADRRDTMSAA